MAQSKAMERYLARKFSGSLLDSDPRTLSHLPDLTDLLGKTEHETAYLDSISEAWVDFNVKWAEFAFAKPDAKDAAKENFISNVWPGVTKIHEGLLAKNGGNGHYHGNSVTWPDLVLLYQLERVEDAMPDLLTQSSAPEMLKALQTMKADPKLKDVSLLEVLFGPAVNIRSHLVRLKPGPRPNRAQAKVVLFAPLEPYKSPNTKHVLHLRFESRPRSLSQSQTHPQS